MGSKRKIKLAVRKSSWLKHLSKCRAAKIDLDSAAKRFAEEKVVLQQFMQFQGRSSLMCSSSGWRREFFLANP